MDISDANSNLSRSLSRIVQDYFVGIHVHHLLILKERQDGEEERERRFTVLESMLRLFPRRRCYAWLAGIDEEERTPLGTIIHSIMISATARGAT